MDEVEVYEWGERPDDRNFIAPMVVATDSRLSMKSRGLMFYLLTLPKGAPMDSVTLSGSLTEGRDAVRTMLKELEECGYITRTRRSLGKGQWVTTCRIFPYGKDNIGLPAAGFSGPEKSGPEYSGPTESTMDHQTPGFQASGVPDRTTLDHQPPEKSGPEKPSSSLYEREGGEVEGGAAATTKEQNQVGEPGLDPSRQPVQDERTEGGVTSQSHIPWTVAHLLETWFGVRSPEQQQAWMQAWSTAISTNGESGYDVETDLTAYLTRCREEKRDAKPSRWLRFLIEDRLKFVKTQQHHDDVLEQRDNADGGEQWALRSLRQTPQWNITEGRE